MDTKRHITILGVLYIGTGIFGVLIGAMVFAILFGVGAVAGDRTAFSVLSFVAVFTLCFISLFSIPGIIAGIALLKEWGWARVFTMIIAVFSLFNIPVGTAIGVYTFWVLMQPGAESYFSGQTQTAVVETQPEAEAPEEAAAE